MAPVIHNSSPLKWNNCKGKQDWNSVETWKLSILHSYRICLWRFGENFFSVYWSQHGRGIWLYKCALHHRILRFLLLQRWVWSTHYETQSLRCEQTSQQIKTPLCSADFAALQLPSASAVVWSSGSLLLSGNYKSKFLRTNFRRCCKCHATTVTHAGLPCMPLKVMVSAFHA